MWAWQDIRGGWHWVCSWFGCNLYGVRRFQFRSEGEGRKLRAVWREVANHYRVYTNGRSIVRDRRMK